MKLSVLTGAALPILIGVVALLSHAPTVQASAQLDQPPAQRVECGDYGIDRFQAMLPPAKGVAIGHGQAAGEEACAKALFELERAMAAEAEARNIPVPRCPGPIGCSPDTTGCLPGITIENPDFMLKLELEEIVSPTGTEVTVCTVTAVGLVTCLTGCDACW